MGSYRSAILNVNKKNIVKSMLSKLLFNPLIIVYDGKILPEVLNFKFPGLHIDKHLNWRSHIEKLLLKLGTISYTVRKLPSVWNISP
jgi:hypothetical protein